ncbi:rRNA (cytosine-C(5))-methyltransferase NOP2C isoform X2 [Rhododendron vialii]|uniref:rRNA (cytosine-C(5))-methyltransferase NOP2C isoform X2 n=1 Tax=Rhododendron vialii TaxID=182163 RepID=UPI00265DF7B4|nr:rRNA (cytosine-C(5))-methyltransferase NOP2C isoform X2 [Rhododendron vialii]XP_058195405.1 rRNA (cytosine-C(5))-methyltransferase NOP2C isoform X2 [Rhododendron vialii]
MKKGRAFLKTICRSFLSLQHRTPAPPMDASERYHYNPTLQWNPRIEEYFIKAYGADHFARISKALTSPSCYSCIRVNTLKSTSDAIIEKLSSALPGIRQQSGTDGTNQSDTHAEYLIGPDHKESYIPPTSYDLKKAYLAVSESGQNYHVSKCQLPGLDYVVFVKGSGPHTVNYGYAQDRPPKEVIVSRKCAEAVLRGAQVYVPGVLACSAHVEKGDVVAVSVAVEQPGQDGGWVVGMTRGTVLQGSHIDPYFLERKGLYIGQGTTMMSRAGMFRVLKGTAVDVNDRVFKLPSFHDVLEGEIFLQNLPSIVTAHVLEPQQGEKILDMCAAPGGKTTAVAILMKDKGEVVAVDRSHNKVLDIQKLAAEMGLNCITTYKLDALKAVRQRSESNDMHTSSCVAQEGSDKDSTGNANFSNEQATQTTKACNAVLQKSIQGHINGRGRSHCLGGRVEKSEGFYPNSFDRVLLDAPCSALGLRPRLFAGEETIEGLRNHAKYQRKMFDQAVQLVRPGGVIVYSTCTINPGENEALVRYALDSYKFLSLALQHPNVGGPGLVGGCQLSDGSIEEWLRPGEEDLVQRFDPSSPLDTIGFFIAKFNVGPKDD